MYLLQINIDSKIEWWQLYEEFIFQDLKKKLKSSCFYINQIYLTPNKGNHYMAKVVDVQDNSVQGSVHIPKTFCRFLHR